MCPKDFPPEMWIFPNPCRFEPISEQLEQLERMAEESLTFLYGPTASARLSHRRDRDRDRDRDKDKDRDKEKDKDRDKDRDRDKGRDRDKAIPVQPRANLSTNFRLSQNFSLVRMWEPGEGRKHSRVGFQLCNSTGGDCFYSSHVSGTAALQEWFRFHFINLLAQLPPALARHPQRFQDLVYSCQYDGEPCRPSDYIPFHHPVFGSCYTFNSKGTDPFWRATKPGIPYGLSLILRAEQQEHIPLLSTVAGVKVMIHSHNQTPFLEHEGFHIRPGIATTIGIRQDQVNRLGGNYGKCTTDGADVAVELLYNSSYTLQACLHSCFQRAMLRHCGCGHIYYPLPAGARYCDYRRQPAWGHCFYQLHWRLRSHRLDCFQHCPKPCRESLYKVSAGTAKWPSVKSQDWVRQALRHQNGYSSSSSRRDVAKVTIFYRQLSSQAVREAPLLSENLLLSSMGSQWSLWFGSSVLSVVEMLELLLDTLVLSLLFCFQRFHAGRSPRPIPNSRENSRESREEPGKGQEWDLGQP
ncbi:Amiloride-sensitive sodium channel subunit alpha [Lonchura striata]|uniref:Amiloride-sensitive sodium channel subunit alpha n=1 Tax=Lonchura striata TaxID=40157 RepID=A0A218UHR7_9PASE|nr:Amiloride-sensitive sodium channel subunit alpha [Lonchura striata domestica]